jgi:hypothetical protein
MQLQGQNMPSQKMLALDPTSLHERLRYPSVEKTWGGGLYFMHRATLISTPLVATERHDHGGPQLVKGNVEDSHVSILSSWKEIAQYLGKGVRTVQRWENELGLPIHRPVPGSRRIVITTKEELAAWLVQQQTRAQVEQRPITHEEFARMKRLVNETLVRAELLRNNAAKLSQEFQRTREAQMLRRNNPPKT